MSMDKTKPATDKSKTPAAVPAPPPPPAATPTVTPPLFRRIDWLTFLVTTLCVLAGYVYTLAPDSGLEDSGELAVASLYGGIPHPPGYPVWTIYTYFWANWLPFGNIAWRVALGIAVSGAVACGLLGLLVSRGSSMMMEGIPQLKEIAGKWENAICIVAGFVGGMLLGYNGYMWSQSIIVEVYSFSVLSLIATMIFLLRWVYAPHHYRYLYLAFFMYGICVNNHQSLLPIAMGLEALILAVKPRLAREFLFWNVVCYLGGLAAGPSLLAGNMPVYVIFNAVGLLSAAAWTWVSVREKREISGYIGGAAVGLGVLLFLLSKPPMTAAPIIALVTFVILRLAAAYDALFVTVARRSREWWVTIASGLSFIVGLAFYLYMPIAGASNPPMQWGYPRTLEGFIHAITRGQYEKIRPTSGTGDTFLEQCMSFITTYAKQVLMYFDGLDNEFNLVCILLAVGAFLFYRFMQRRERNWLIGVTAIFICLGPMLVLLLNPPPDRQARDLIRVFFTASHVVVSIGVGYGMALVAAYMATHYQSFRRVAIGLGIVAFDFALYALAVDTYDLFTDPEVAGTNLFMNGLVKVTYILLAGISLVLATFQLMRTSESGTSQWKPAAALAGIGFICLLISVTLFRHAQLTTAQEALTGFAKFSALIQSPAEIGTDAPAMLAIAKVLMVLVAATSLFFASHQKLAGDQLVSRILAGFVLLGSAGLTLVVLMGEQISLGGIGQFFALLMKIFEPGQFALPVWASIFMLGLMGVFIAGLLLWKNRAPLALTLAVFAAVPLQSYMANWGDNEQRGHIFGYWFGHDMFTPPFKDKDGKPLYPEMTRNAILYGGTDPGRFCPTYTIFCESFTPPECKPLDPEFDRRDVYIITQNALADGTYLNYIRAHYHRSAQKRRGLDTPFFQEVGRLLQKPEDRATSTNWLGRALLPLDRMITNLGESIEKRRRAGSSFFAEDHFVDVKAFAAKLAQPANEFSRELAAKLKPETRALLTGGDEDDLKEALARDLNEVLESGLFDDQALAASVDLEWNTLFEYERMQDEKQQLMQMQAGPLAMQRVLSREAVVKQRLAAIKAERQNMADAVAARLTANGAPVTPYLKAFIYEAPQSFTRIRLQRLLIEAAFPTEIIRSKGGVYPDREMHIASPQESQECFAEYMADAQRRLQAGQLRPGEDVKFVGGKVQVSGQVAVMAINGLLTKVMFDKNPDNEFFVEESFPLEWMYPHLTPFGIIMKINRQPLPTFTEDIFERDHQFWRQYSERLIGDRIDYDTPVSEIVAFVEKVYLRRNWSDLNAEQRKFARDDNGQKAFSKLRSSIGGVYAWRLGATCPPEYRPKTEAEIRRFYKEADFTFRQAFAFCPYSPEALFRYVQLLAQPPAPIAPRIDDALLIARTAQKLDPYNTQISYLVSSLEDWKRRSGDLASLQKLEADVRANPNNLSAAVTLAYTLLNAQQYDRAYELMDTVVNHPNVDMVTLAPVVDLYKQLNNFPKLEAALVRLTKLRADSPEAWYDLGTVRMALSKPAESVTAFTTAFQLSDARRATNPTALDLKATARADANLAPIRAVPEFQKLLMQ
jgi:tetratricopeptide (TPR) repeat protein